MNIVQKTTPNFDIGRQGTVIDRVVCHWIVGDLAAADAVFNKSSSQVSAHYAVGSNEIHQYINESNTAWHAGKYDMNLRSIGIEHRGGPTIPIDDATYKNSAELLADICNRNNIPLDRIHIIKHQEVVATQCPGTLDIDRLISMAKGVIPTDPCAQVEKELDEMRVSRDKWKRDYKDLEVKYESETKTQKEHIESLQSSQSEMNLQLTNMTNQYKLLSDEKSSLADSFNAQKVQLDNAAEKILNITGKLEKQIEANMGLQEYITELKDKIKKGLGGYTKLQLFRALISR